MTGDRRSGDLFGRVLEVLLGLLVGLMGGRIFWRGLTEGFDLERILGGGVMLAAGIALGVHAIRRGRGGHAGPDESPAGSHTPAP